MRKHNGGQQRQVGCDRGGLDAITANDSNGLSAIAMDGNGAREALADGNDAASLAYLGAIGETLGGSLRSACVGEWV